MGVEMKRSLTQPISARGWRSWTPAEPNGWLCGVRPASGCSLDVVGGGGRGAPLSATPQRRSHTGPAAAAEGGAGQARMSATEPQVAAGAGLSRSTRGEYCPWTPTNPPGPRSPACARTVTPSSGSHGGQRRGGAWGDGEQGFGGLHGGRPGLAPVVIRGPRWEIGTPVLISIC